MNHKDIKLNLEKLGSPFSINGKLAIGKIRELEFSMGVEFPDQVVNFYQNINGLSVESPMLELHSIDNIVKRGSLIEFAVFNGSIPVAFDISGINRAGQWDIVNLNTKYVITLTMTSFLTNKIWAWLNRGRKIWAEEVYT